MTQRTGLIRTALAIGLLFFAAKGAHAATPLPCDAQTAAECQITTLHNLGAGGDFTVDRTLHIFGAPAELRTNPGSTLTLSITGKLIIESGGKITGNAVSPNRGATIIITASDTVLLAGNGTTGAAVTADQSGSCTSSTGGNITLQSNATAPVGSITIQSGAKVTVNAACPAGAIRLSAPNGGIEIAGLVQSRSSLTGGSRKPGGGPITVNAGCNLAIDDTGVVSSSGRDPGADLVHLQGGCSVVIQGLVESTGPGHEVPNNPPNHCNGANRPGKPSNSTACVEVWAGDNLLIDATSGHQGQINADTAQSGGFQIAWIDLFARGPITIAGNGAGTGPYQANAGPYAVHANEFRTNSQGGIITVKSTTAGVTTLGWAIQADSLLGGAHGGFIVVEAGGPGTLNANDVDFGSASIRARGATFGGAPRGGTISARSFHGDVLGGAPGELNASGGTPGNVSQQGSVTLQSCGVVAYTGTSTPAPFFHPPDGDCTHDPILPSYVTLPSCVCQFSQIIVSKVTTCSGGAVSDTSKFSVTAHVSGSGAIITQPATQNLVSGSPVTYQVTPGTYFVTEDDPLPFGWTRAGNTCLSAFTLGTGQTKNCTITNENPSLCAPQHGTLRVSKVTTCNGVPINDPTGFSINASGNGAITGGGARTIFTSAPIDYDVVAPGTYSVSETVPGGWALTGNTCSGVSVSSGQISTCTITNEKSSCSSFSFCPAGTVQAVLNPQTGRFPGNRGADVVVDVRTQSLQNALDTVTDANGDGYIIIGVIAADNGAAGGQGSQEVQINKHYDKPFALIGCHVTVRDLNHCNGVAPIQITSSAGSPEFPLGSGVTLYIQEITAVNSDSAPGWVIDGNGRFLEAVGSQGNLLGFQITGDGNTVHNSFANNNLGGGLTIKGNGNTVDTVQALSNAGGDGVQVTGNGNTIRNSTAGDAQAGNGGNGITVNGKGNLVDSNFAFQNGADGINVSGGTGTSPSLVNVVKGNQSGSPLRGGNAANGIVLGGTGNGGLSPIELEGNTTQDNSLDGIKVTGSGHQIKNNHSGGSGSKTNGVCQYDVAAGNIDAGGNTIGPAPFGTPVTVSAGCQ